MYCNKCGAENPSDANFCQKCGFSLSHKRVDDETKYSINAKNASTRKFSTKNSKSLRGFLILFILLFLASGVIGILLYSSLNSFYLKKSGTHYYDFEESKELNYLEKDSFKDRSFLIYDNLDYGGNGWNADVDVSFNVINNIKGCTVKLTDITIETDNKGIVDNVDANVYLYDGYNYWSTKYNDLHKDDIIIYAKYDTDMAILKFNSTLKKDARIFFIICGAFAMLSLLIIIKILRSKRQ